MSQPSNFAASASVMEHLYQELSAVQLCTNLQSLATSQDFAHIQLCVLNLHQLLFPAQPVRKVADINSKQKKAHSSLIFKAPTVSVEHPTSSPFGSHFPSSTTAVVSPDTYKIKIPERPEEICQAEKPTIEAVVQSVETLGAALASVVQVVATQQDATSKNFNQMLTTMDKFVDNTEAHFAMHKKLIMANESRLELHHQLIDLLNTWNFKSNIHCKIRQVHLQAPLARSRVCVEVQNTSP